MLVKLTERIKDGYFASPAILQVSNFIKRRPTVEVMMILHMMIFHAILEPLASFSYSVNQLFQNLLLTLSLFHKTFQSILKSKNTLSFQNAKTSNAQNYFRIFFFFSGLRLKASKLQTQSGTKFTSDIS